MGRNHLLRGLLVTGFILVAPLAARQGVSRTLVFERTVHNLGEVGVGTGNLCEFRFGNTGYAPLKITGVKATCGCTVVQLDKREYAAAESGVIKVTYTAGEQLGGRFRG